MLRLLTAAYGTEPLCPHVRDDGEYWRVSGPSDIANLALMIHPGLLTALVISPAD
jgi:hypothetical protein